MKNGVMLPTREVARMLGVHENTIRRWTDSGLLPAYRYGTRRDRKFKEADIERFLREHKQGG